MKTRFVALVGHAGSGKDTVADFLGVKKFSFAEPLKEFCQKVFAFSDSQVYGPSEERNRPDPRYIREDGEVLTPRYALQKLGTEWGRGCYPNVWADLGVRRVLHHLAREPYQHAVITDCRFVNEAKAIREAGGQIWRIVRPGAELDGGAGLHSSEQEMDTPEMAGLTDIWIYNDGTLEDLRREVHGLSADRLGLESASAH